MPTYVLPQVLVFQDFTRVPAVAAAPLRAHITGPHAQLVRYAQDDERDLGRLDYYDWLNDTVFGWPNRPAGGEIDQPYVKLWVKDALLKYFEDTVGSGSTITKTAGFKNRIHSDNVNFASNGDSYPRAAVLLDRDVQLGDTVKVRFVPLSGDPVTLWTYVTAIIGDTVAAILGTPSIDTDNADTHSGATTAFSQVRGPFNAVEITAASAAAYDPYPTGQVTETYTIIVTESSINGDFTKARLRIISASGLDDQSDVIPGAEGTPTDIGANGATVTFDDTGGATASASALDQDVSPNDLIAGQKFQLTVHANFTATAVPVASGTYTGTADTTYIVTVVKGNKFATAAAQIQVSTTTGVDISGPTDVEAAATAIAVGTKGVLMTFAGAGLALGDKFYVSATAAGAGPKRNLVLGHNISEDVDDGTECDVTLFIRKPLLEVTQNRIGFAPQTNFDMTETQITVNNGIIAYDETWTDNGVQQALPVESELSQGYGLLFVEYRAWLQTLCHEINSINDVGLLNDAIAGSLHPDNPLKWAVFKALENSNGVDVKFTSVCNPNDVDSWTDVIELLLGRDDVYGLVPLTKDRTIQDLFAAHVKDESVPEQGLWRVAWFNLSGVPAIPVVHAGSDVPGHTEATTSNGHVCLAIVEDDANSSGTQYTIVRVPAGNGKFVTNEVRAGDIVRMLYTGDGFGGFSYQEFVVDEVETEDQLRLLAGPGAAINVAAKIEIWRNLTATEEATEIAKSAGEWGDRRIRAVWPDRIETSGTIQEGYHLCAALSGLTSGVLPQQGLTNLEIVGFTDVPRTTSKFNRPQLDLMAGSGVWIVTQDLTIDGNVGNIFSRHAVTTGTYSDINQREEMLTRNVDSISFRFKDTFAPFIGVTNVVPSMIELIRIEVLSLIDVLKTEKATRELGGQLIDATIRELRAHATLKDRIVCFLDVVPPFPLNNLEIHLVI